MMSCRSSSTLGSLPNYNYNTGDDFSLLITNYITFSEIEPFCTALLLMLWIF